MRTRTGRQEAILYSMPHSLGPPSALGTLKVTSRDGMVRGEAPRDALVPDPLVNQYPLTVRRISHGPFECGADWYNHIGIPGVVGLYMCLI